MNELSAITAVLSGLKLASDIARNLSQSDLNMEQAALKIKLADLYEALASARMLAVDLQGELSQKDEEIKRLLEAVSLKGDVEKCGDAYFRKETGDGKYGDPCCVYCWDSRKALVHIHRRPVKGAPDEMYCPHCKTVVSPHSIDWPVTP